MKPAVQTSQCSCGATTRDGACLCESCLNDLVNVLAGIGWIDEQLDITIARLRGANLGGSASSSGDTPLPFHDAASTARRDLHKVLTRWVRLCDRYKVRNSSPLSGLPYRFAADPTSVSLTAMAKWLHWRVDGLAWFDSGAAALREIKAAADKAREIVEWQPPVREFLGPCGLPTLDGGRCAGDVYADEGEDLGECRSCRQPHARADRRQKLEAELDDRLCTAGEIARMVVYLGGEVPREKVGHRVNVWHSRGVITPAGYRTQKGKRVPVFRYGDIRQRLAVDFQRKDTA